MPLGAVPVQAQSWWAVTYAPSVPLSNTKTFADNASWRGINVEYKKAIKENVTAGLSFGWHVFDEQTDEVVSAFGVDISGDQFRYVNSFPMLLNVSYFLGKTGGIRPFIGADAGVYIMEHRLDVGLYTIHETNAHIGFAPEAGFAIPVRPNMSLLVTGRYNYALSAGNVDDQQYLNFGVGFAWNQGF
jgi:outer membrane protein W